MCGARLGGEQCDCAQAWVFSGAVLPTHRDFVSTMMALEKRHDTISVVDDQHGNPTFAPDLALGLWEVCHVQPTGFFTGLVLGRQHGMAWRVKSLKI